MIFRIKRFTKNEQIIQLYHVTPQRNIESIMKYGLDSSRGSTIEICEEDKKQFEKERGIPYRLPYHYTNMPRAIYFSTDIEDSLKLINHYEKLVRFKEKIRLLSIRIPKNELKKIQCENPKLLGAKNWREYRKLVEKYEPEILSKAKMRGDSEQQINDKMKRAFENESTRICIRGVVSPQYIEIMK